MGQSPASCTAAFCAGLMHGLSESIHALVPAWQKASCSAAALLVFGIQPCVQPPPAFLQKTHSRAPSSTRAPTRPGWNSCDHTLCNDHRPLACSAYAPRSASASTQSACRSSARRSAWATTRTTAWCGRCCTGEMGEGKGQGQGGFGLRRGQWPGAAGAVQVRRVWARVRVRVRVMGVVRVCRAAVRPAAGMVSVPGAVVAWCGGCCADGTCT